MTSKTVLSISSFKTAARHWIPINSRSATATVAKNIKFYPTSTMHYMASNTAFTPAAASPIVRHFSTRHRAVNTANLPGDVLLVSNDDVLSSRLISGANSRNGTRNIPSRIMSSMEEPDLSFEPMVSSNEEIMTAGPVIRA
ncbi:uncharacterized protein KQ657_004702 [Scheffersomyces spartinae]|uniref:Uncharacterized protein n=1 Tax=Scheffersomyces spartinae TaxID=45513 RepID=A0A9P8AIL0_9ASCO|nr:uncharacterized protein KQ657_004702 [Scheffersomyces spartinae]KAG7194488.1 hypothetical protein KQ657_004702 [Scheffersomyces spartinae]